MAQILAFGRVWGKLRRVNKLWASPLLRSRYPLAVAAGLLLAGSFPKIGIAGFAWIAPALMLAAALGKSGAEAFRIGYVAGLTHYLASLYWLLLIPYRWHSIPLGPTAGWLALSAFLALFPAVWVWLVSPVHIPQSTVHSPRSTVREQSPVSSLKSQVEHQSEARGLTGDLRLETGDWSWRTLWALGGGAVWVGLEMILARVFGGFPWNLLGASQYQMTPLIQIASVTGIYGVSFLVVWVSLSLLSAGLRVIQRPNLRSVWIGEILLPLVVVFAALNFGLRVLRQAPPAGRVLKVTLVQPSIPQTLIWDPSKAEERFGDLLRLSEQALTNQTDLLVWPEAAVPKLLRYDKETFDAVTGLARRHRVWMIVGADDAEPRRNPARPDDADFFNSSFLISPEGRVADPYRKRNLVIFGEYIPLQRWLPFLKFVTPAQGSFTPGDRAVQFGLKDLEVKASVLICFEDIFPQLARGSVGPDTDVLVNLTNNGWFDESAAQWQHAASALFRTVENGVPLIRCANNGLTCWVDAHGRLRQVFRDHTGGIYGAGVLTAEVPLPAPGEQHAPTFYNEHGDWFGWACVASAGAILVRRVWRRRRSA